MSENVKNAFLAGLVVVVGLGIGAYFFLASKKSTLDTGNSVACYALLTDAAGVNAKSLVTVAGLQVGEIAKISLVPVPLHELVPDYALRARRMLTPDDPALAEVRLERNDDFDAVVRRLIEGSGAKTIDDVEKLRDEAIRVARVDMRITRDVAIPDDTWVKKDSLGLLGAKALFLELGRSTTLIGDGGRILRVRSMTGTDALLAQAEGIVGDVRSITKKIDGDIGGITHDIKGITGELNRFIAGDKDSPPLDELYRMVVTDLRQLTRTLNGVLSDVQRVVRDNDGQIKELVANVNRITHDIADLTGEGGGAGGIGGDGNKGGTGDVRATMASVRKISDDLAAVTGQVRSVLGDNEKEVGDGVKQLQTTITELNRTLTSLSEVAGRVERGEGTVGRLLTDERIADKVESAVSGAADYVSTLTSIEAHVDVGSWYNFNRARATTTLSLKLQPRPDKFYLVEVVEDGGNVEQLTETTTSDGTTRESIHTEDNQLRLTAMVAQRFFDVLVLRAGLVENTGGVGANLFLLDDRLELRTDLFGTRGPRDSLVTDAIPFYLPRWRTIVKAQPLPHLYVSGGVDDVLNAWNWEQGGTRLYNSVDGFGVDWFLGVGLTFKDDDLRAILPLIPGG